MTPEEWKEKKKEEENPEKEVFRISGEAIRRTGVSQCTSHVFRKLSDNEVACTVCPTALVVEDINAYLA